VSLRFAAVGRGLRALALGAAALALVACAGRPDLEDYAGAAPPFAPELFFDGDLMAWGVFQDRFGAVRRSFFVEIDGDWDGETLTLDERFTYEDGATERRVWRLRKTGPDSWAGTAEGVVGEATGAGRGGAAGRDAGAGDRVGAVSASAAAGRPSSGAQMLSRLKIGSGISRMTIMIHRQNQGV